jgi:hypothetical protein
VASYPIGAELQNGLASFDGIQGPFTLASDEVAVEHLFGECEGSRVGFSCVAECFKPGAII